MQARLRDWFDSNLKVEKPKSYPDGRVLLYKDGAATTVGGAVSSVYQLSDGKYCVRTLFIEQYTCAVHSFWVHCDSLTDVFITLVDHALCSDSHKVTGHLNSLKCQQDPSWQPTKKNVMELRECCREFLASL